MGKITFLFLLIFGIAETHAQNYQISFTGTGASTTVDSVKVENVTQCTDTILGGSDILNLDITTGINESNNSIDNHVNMYPNPMTGTCSIDFQAIAQGQTTIELYSICGKRILQVQELLSKGHHTYCLNGISSGVYFLKIESEKYSYTSEIVSCNAQSGLAEIKHIETSQGIGNKSTNAGTGKVKNLETGKSVIDMQYTTGDMLKFTGKSGNFRTVIMLIPANSQTVTFTFVNCTDADSNHYAVVQIGTQLWMAENLKTTKYSNGDTIPNVTDGNAWSNLTSGAYCNYNNTTNTDTINTYGRLYNWIAVTDSPNIAPTGWHVASDSEWTVLITYLGGESIAGGKLKENCTMLWYSPNTGATNESGFTAFPGGMRWGGNGPFADIGYYGHWWTTTIDFGPGYYINIARLVGYNSSWVTKESYFDSGYGYIGASVRCVSD